VNASIPVAGPWITDKEIRYAAEAAADGWFENANKYQKRFEDAFGAYLGRRFAVSLPSCTSAIHLALAAWGIGPGDEVIVPELSWIASAAPITYLGAVPVFADVDAASWCLSPQSVESCLSSRTRAVIAVDLYGHVADVEALRRLTSRAGIRFLEDAAEAIGSESGGRKAGAFGDASVFSFHGSKTLTTGEGGMLVTDDEALYQRVLTLRDHGRPPGDRLFRNTEVAYKYKMSAMQAALGLAQLERIEELVARKREIFSWYQEALRGVEGVTLNPQAAGTLNTYWMVTVLLDPGFGLEKETLMEEMSRKGIDSRPFFYPMSSLPAFASSPYAGGSASRNPVSYKLSPRGINLPSALVLSRPQVQTVCQALKEILAVYADRLPA